MEFDSLCGPDNVMFKTFEVEAGGRWFGRAGIVSPGWYWEPVPAKPLDVPNGPYFTQRSAEDAAVHYLHNYRMEKEAKTTSLAHVIPSFDEPHNHYPRDRYRVDITCEIPGGAYAVRAREMFDNQLTLAFGGYTSYRTIGGWKDSKGHVSTNSGRTWSVSVTTSAEVERLRSMARALGRAMRQTWVHVEVTPTTARHVFCGEPAL